MNPMRRIAAGTRSGLARERGYTLVELIVVMVILGIVLAGLTTAFTAGTNAELRAHREFQAQQEARAAVDRLRREIHCASALAATPGIPVASVTVTLPTVCPGPDTSVTYATTSVGTNRWRLTRTAGAGTPVKVADYITSGTIFTYTAPASGTLGKLSVNVPVNINPADATTEWRLVDDIVMRNTDRL
jgi:prepilin-type N-terminal cleavage/methylation domain-containing protein